MTIDEKLSHFYDITVEEAHEKAAAILDEHKAALEKMAEEHKTLSEENAQTQIKAETASARREINKALSAEQLTIKRDWTRNLIIEQAGIDNPSYFSRIFKKEFGMTPTEFMEKNRKN